MPVCVIVDILAIQPGTGEERSKEKRTTGSSSYGTGGEAHPQTCLMDGIQAATGATYGEVLIVKTFRGKPAATLYGLPTVAYTEGFKMNRGLEQAQTARQQRDDLTNWLLRLPLPRRRA